MLIMLFPNITINITVVGKSPDQHVNASLFFNPEITGAYANIPQDDGSHEVLEEKERYSFRLTVEAWWKVLLN